MASKSNPVLFSVALNAEDTAVKRTDVFLTMTADKWVVVAENNFPVRFTTLPSIAAALAAKENKVCFMTAPFNAVEVAVRNANVCFVMLPLNADETAATD